MIVFIATILVAAVAAGVLIDVSSKLQERSSKTGTEASAQVATNLHVESIVGRRDSAVTAGLQDLDLYVGLAPGASRVDLFEVNIQLQDGTLSEDFVYDNDATPDANEYYATEFRDTDDSFTNANPVLTAGDLILITFDLTHVYGTETLQFEPRQDVEVVFMPEVGAKMALGFTTPTSYGSKLVIEIR